MNKHREKLLAAAIAVLVSNAAFAEMWPTFENYVDKCVLIVKAKTVSDGVEKPLTFQVLESWKGQYRPELLKNTTPDGRFIEFQGHHGIDVTNGQEIVFFFTRHNQPDEGPMISHSTAFPVKDGKVVYGSTSDGLRKEYTLAEFKKKIHHLMKTETKETQKSEPPPGN